MIWCSIIINKHEHDMYNSFGLVYNSMHTQIEKENNQKNHSCTCDGNNNYLDLRAKIMDISHWAGPIKGIQIPELARFIIYYTCHRYPASSVRLPLSNSREVSASLGPLPMPFGRFQFQSLELNYQQLPTPKILTNQLPLLNLIHDISYWCMHHWSVFHEITEHTKC